MDVSVARIREAVVRAKNEATIAGVEAEHIDAVAAVIALMELTGLRDSSKSETDSSIEVIAIPETFAEWAYNYNITTHYDRFLAIMVYLFEQGTRAVTTADIHRMYEKARWKKPANAADVFNKGAERMYFAEAEYPDVSDDGLKLWRITQTGYQAFNELRLD